MVISVELMVQRPEIERDCKYVQYIQDCASFVMRESGMDYASAMVLLRNIGERKDTTSLEREAIATAVRLLKNNMEVKES